ncbi:MAG: hypothetical protein KGK08_02325 [Acidobacteriota bacterium]|nr:hypothetical protein [Acidobacteriota bacterium]
MNRSLPLLLALALATATPVLHAQASAIPSAAPESASLSPEQRGRQLLDQMVNELGGTVWVHRKDMTVEGRTAAFFRGEPNGSIVDYHLMHRFAASGQPEAERLGFLSDRSMILPGKKIDIVQLYTADAGYELTFKGRTTLPADQTEDYFRRRKHSIEAVIDTWLKQPGVMVVYEGTSMVERHLADQVTVLSANNDAVTLDLDASSHLPLRRSFRWRNQQFKDYDEDVETYDDYHVIQGLPTPLRISRYRNGDLVSQRYFSRVEYNTGLSPDLFDPDKLPKKK